LDVVSKFNCPFVITHSRGNSQNMNQLSNYQNVLSDVKSSLDNLIKNALEKNISESTKLKIEELTSKKNEKKIS